MEKSFYVYIRDHQNGGWALTWRWELTWENTLQNIKITVNLWLSHQREEYISPTLTLLQVWGRKLKEQRIRSRLYPVHREHAKDAPPLQDDVIQDGQVVPDQEKARCQLVGLRSEGNREVIGVAVWRDQGSRAC